MPLQFGRIPVFSYRSTQWSNPAFSPLRLSSKVKSLLWFNDFERVVRAFISPRPDYCNALHAGVSQTSVSRLQLVQIAAAGAHFHRTGLPSLASCFRIDFKIFLFDLKSPNGRAPIYLSDLSQSHALLRSLRSANQMLSMVPTSRLKHREAPSFAVVAPKLWNDLLLHCYAGPLASSF